MIDLQVRDDDLHTILARGRTGLEWSAALDNLDQARFPMFGHLIPYADTIFNSRQIPTLLGEVPRLPSGLLSDDFILELRGLCRFTLSQPHRYLWFVGD